jgi:hypothetical protein
MSVAQNRPVVTTVDGSVDCSGHCRRQWNQDGLVALAADLEHAVAVFLAEVVDGGAAGFEDP